MELRSDRQLFLGSHEKHLRAVTPEYGAWLLYSGRVANLDSDWDTFDIRHEVKGSEKVADYKNILASPA